MAGSVSGSTTDTQTAPDRHDPAPTAEKRPAGGQRGNLNAQKHGAYLNARKRDARLARDRFRRRAEREGRAVLVAMGLEGNPLARMVIRNMARLEANVYRLQAHHERRGYFKASGELKPSVAKEVEIVAKLLDEARKMLMQMQEKGATGPTRTERHIHEIRYLDTADLDEDGDTDAKPEQPPLPDERPEAKPEPEPEPDPDPEPERPTAAATARRATPSRSTPSPPATPPPSPPAPRTPTPADLFGWSDIE